jgi:hypothetical protein
VFEIFTVGPVLKNFYNSRGSEGTDRPDGVGDVSWVTKRINKRLPGAIVVALTRLDVGTTTGGDEPRR